MTVRLGVAPRAISKLATSAWSKVRPVLEPIPKSLLWAQVGALAALVLVLGGTGTPFLLSVVVLAIHLSACGLLIAGWSRMFTSLVERVRAVRRSGASPAGVEELWGPLGGEVRRLLDTFERARTNIEESRFSTVKAMALAMEARDVSTQGHCVRVRTLTRRLLDRLNLDPQKREAIELASLVHDIGKIGVPDRILLKPGKLTPEERKRVRLHAEIGYEILSNFEGMKDVALFVKHHHERFDGTGYPGGLKGDQIPIGSRVIAVADSIDAMRSLRPYGTTFSFEEIVQELLEVRGTQLDPELVDIATSMLKTHVESQRVAKQVLDEGLTGGEEADLDADLDADLETEAEREIELTP